MVHSSIAKDPGPIKSPNVSGQFYPAQPEALSREVKKHLSNARRGEIDGKVRMILAPHAGYMYSGGVAGYSFAAAKSVSPKTVIVLAPSHYFGFDGASVWPRGGMRTPLGVLSVDEEFAGRLIAADPKFVDQPQAFDKEHALEVELPFLQEIYKDIKVVPVILGQMSFETIQKLAAALDQLIGSREDVLVVISSDFSHYHDGQKARAMDLATLKLIEGLEAKKLYDQCRLGASEMCGFVPMTTGLVLAAARGWSAHTLKYAHSGDVTGDNQRVVGYGSVVFTQNTGDGKGVLPLSDAQKHTLLETAKNAVHEFIRHGKKIDVKTSDPRLEVTEGAFVSLYKHGELRGCIGHIIGQGPLIRTVRDVAISSAVEDPRFARVAQDELPELTFEVSILSRPWKAVSADEIVMGQHGVIISRGRFNKGVFLPQVATETGWSKERFLAELCSQKAGLAPDCWKDPAVTIELFTAEVFGEDKK